MDSTLLNSGLNFEEGDKLYFQSRYFEADKAYKTILDDISTSPNISPLELAALYHKIGLCSYKLAKFSDAHSFLSKALDITKIQGNNALETAKILYAIGETFTREGNFSEAEEKLKVAFAFIKGIYGEEHREMVVCYNKLAYLCEQKEEYEEVLKHTDSALKISLALKLEQDPEVATSYYRSANAHWYLEHQEKSNESIQKCLLIRQHIYGEDHVETALCYRLLGDIEKTNNRLSEALVYYNKGVNVLIKLLGDDHLELDDFYCNTGRIYFRLKQYMKSLEYHKKCLEIQKRFYPEDHQYLSYTYGDFSNIFREQGKYKEAHDAYDKAIKQCAGKLGENHWRTGLFLADKAYVYVRQELFSEARKLLKKQLAIEIQHYGPKDPQLVDSYDNLAFLYCRDLKYKKAIQNFLKSLSINNDLLKERLPGAAFDFFNLSHAFQYVGNTNSQESLAKKAFICYAKTNGKETEYAKIVLEAAQTKKYLDDQNNNSI